MSISVLIKDRSSKRDRAPARLAGRVITRGVFVPGVLHMSLLDRDYETVHASRTFPKWGNTARARVLELPTYNGRRLDCDSLSRLEDGWSSGSYSEVPILSRSPRLSHWIWVDQISSWTLMANWPIRAKSLPDQGLWTMTEERVSYTETLLGRRPSLEPSDAYSR